jgi:hypothetical protein
LSNTSPTSNNYSVKYLNLPANTTFYIRAVTNWNDGLSKDILLAAAAFSGTTYLGQLNLTLVS